MWKGVKRNVERQNNNENQYGRNRRKTKEKLFYRAACAMLGLLIVCVILELCIFSESKDPVLPSKENTKTGKDYSFWPTVRVRMSLRFRSQPYPTGRMRLT